MRQLRALTRRQAQERESQKKAIAIFSNTPTPGAATRSSRRNANPIRCGGSARCRACRPAAILPGNKASSGPWGANHRRGKPRWSRPFGTINAATAPAGCGWPCARRAAAATATTTRRPKACGRASKRRYSNCASGPFLPTWPMRRLVSPIILTTTTTTGCPPASTIGPPITLPNNFFQLLP